MKLSIVTVNRNNAAGLRATLESTFGAQSGFADWEQIVVDGNSTDGSFSEIDRHRTDPHLGWCVSEPDSGIYDAMNKGAAHARGDRLLFLNSGDTLLPDVLEKVFADPPDADILYGDLAILKKDGETVKRYPAPGEIRDWHFLYESLPHPASFVSRRLFESLGGYDESFRIVSDAKFFMEAVLGGAKLAQLPFAVSRFRTDGVSFDKSRMAEHLAERRRMLAPVFGERLAERVTRPKPKPLPSCIRPAVLLAAARDKRFARYLLRANDAVRAAYRTRFGRFVLERLARRLEEKEARSLRRTRKAAIAPSGKATP